MASLFSVFACRFFPGWNIKKFLVRKIDPKNIEEAFEVEHREFYCQESDGSGISPHFMKTEWEPFIKKMLHGDELWFYRLPCEYWRRLRGFQGYAILRGKKVVAKIITKKN